MSRGTHVWTTPAHPSSSIARAKYLIHSGRWSYEPRACRHSKPAEATGSILAPPTWASEPARPAVDVAGAVQHGQRFAGHGAVIDEAIRQLEAGGRDPLVRLVQGRGGVAHIVLFLRRIRPCQPQRPGLFR